MPNSFEMERSPHFAKLRSESTRNLAAFWLLGLFNNSSYVIMIAGAITISQGGVGIVYLCAILPGIFLKATAPYWIHLLSYSHRVLIASALMAASFATVALSTSRPPQLAGVVLASLQGSLGEASCLALSSHYHSQSTITMWSSGTGFAGVFGYTWVAMLHLVLRLPFAQTLMWAQITVLGYLAAFFMVLESPEERSRQVRQLVAADAALVGAAMKNMNVATASSSSFFPVARLNSGSGSGNSSTIITNSNERQHQQQLLVRKNSYDNNANEEGEGEEDEQEIERGGEMKSLLGAESNGITATASATATAVMQKSSKIHKMSARERLLQTLALWPYTIPLFSVYAAEYVMQAGVWSAIGLPSVTDAASRQRFYSASNWCYQAGVFISRSSGMAWQVERKLLWAMPVAQLGLLAVFISIAISHWWYNWSLLVPCFMAGLLGGAVYVNAFTLIAREVEPQYREFSLGAASVADSAGIAVADVVSVFLQGCLFAWNGIKGADFTCT